ncbi:MAG TPA: hypothetical protein VLO12_12950 [Halomonas sp.]|nr:hypothetical protein [Halomonas sp.]
MKRIHDTHPALHAFGISLLLTGLLGAGAALADDASGNSGQQATQGSMAEDCPEDMKEDDGECPSDWPSESLGDAMPQENGSTETTDGSGGTQAEEEETDSIGTGGTGSGTGTSGTGGGGTGTGSMGSGSGGN